MLEMKRFCMLITAVATIAAVSVPASADAAVVELGATKTPLVAPTCPPGVTAANCTIILTQVTALETIRDGIAYPTTVKKAGAIVAFTIGLSRLSTDRTTAHNDIHFLDQTYGGTTRASVTVLRRSGRKKNFKWTVVGQSAVIHLQPYLGQVVQIPLPQSLPVKAGDVIGLTVPTWAPVLSIQLPTAKFAYRQSRSRNCAAPPASSQAQALKKTATYKCNYPGTRVEYTATEITNPVSVNPIHGPRR
jgi:hypothetical protein